MSENNHIEQCKNCGVSFKCKSLLKKKRRLDRLLGRRFDTHNCKLFADIGVVSEIPDIQIDWDESPVNLDVVVPENREAFCPPPSYIEMLERELNGEMEALERRRRFIISNPDDVAPL